jgi:hypothetical protein
VASALVVEGCPDSYTLHNLPWPRESLFCLFWLHLQLSIYWRLPSITFCLFLFYLLGNHRHVLSRNCLRLNLLLFLLLFLILGVSLLLL